MDFTTNEVTTTNNNIDQIIKVFKSLKESPESRRHIISAVDPAHDQDLALYWCHALFQFNCRKLNLEQRIQYYANKTNQIYEECFPNTPDKIVKKFLDSENIPTYYLDGHLYQRSGDVFLGVPYNIASYSLLIHIFAKLLNMVPGDFIHTFGDVHLYETHKEAAELQLSRDIRPLPKLDFSAQFEANVYNIQELLNNKIYDVLNMIFDECTISDFQIIEYNPHPKIEAVLSTGLK